MRTPWETTEYEAGKIALARTAADTAEKELKEARHYLMLLGSTDSVRQINAALVALRDAQHDIHRQSESLAARKAKHQNRKRS